MWIGSSDGLYLLDLDTSELLMNLPLQGIISIQLSLKHKHALGSNLAIVQENICSIIFDLGMFISKKNSNILIFFFNVYKKYNTNKCNSGFSGQ